MQNPWEPDPASDMTAADLAGWNGLMMVAAVVFVLAVAMLVLPEEPAAAKAQHEPTIGPAVQSTTDRVLHPSDVLVTTDWSTNIAWWNTTNKTLRIANLPADALVCIAYGGTEVCKLPAQWVGR